MCKKELDQYGKPKFDRFGVLFLRTPNPDCHACRDSRIHNDLERLTFHPEMRHGFNRAPKLAGG